MRAPIDVNGSAGPDLGAVSEIDLVVQVFRMMSDPTRVRLLSVLVDHEHSVSELSTEVGKSRACVSQHLAKLRLSRLVRSRREGNHTVYRLENEHVSQLVVDAIRHAEHVIHGDGEGGAHTKHAHRPAPASRSARGRRTSASGS